MLPGVEEVASEAAGHLVALLTEAGIARTGSGGEATSASSLASSIGLSGDEWSTSLQPRLLEAAVKLVTGATAAGTGAAAAAAAGSVTVPDVVALAPLFATATAAQAASLVLPALGRALKSRADAVLPLSGPLLGALSVDISGGVEEHLLPTLTSAAVNGARDDVRAWACDLARAIGSHAADGAVLGKVAAALADVLIKKKVSVPLWQARHGLTKALVSLVTGARASVVGLPPAALAKLATDAGATLVAAALKETHDGVRQATVAALGPILAALAASAAEARTAMALPADLAAALSKGLAASAPLTAAAALAAGGAPSLGDGFAEALYYAVTDGADAPPAASFTPAGEAAAKALAKAPEVVAGLIELVSKAGSSYLGSKKALAASALANVAFSLATLVRLGRVDPTVADKMSAVKMSGEAGAAGPSVAAGKPAATSAAAKPAAKPAAAAAKPAAGKAAAASPVLPAGLALPPKTYDLWDCLTTPALAPHTLFAPALVSPAGKTHRELSALAPAIGAVVGAVCGALAWHGDLLKPYSKAYVAAVMADLRAETAGGARADASTSAAPAPAAGKPAVAGAAAEEAKPTPKKAGPLFVGLVTLLSHPLHSVRSTSASAVRGLYASPSGLHWPLPQCLLHALADRVRAHEGALTQPSLAPEASPQAFDTGIGHGAVAVNAAVALMEAQEGKLLFAGAAAAAAAGAGGDKAAASADGAGEAASGPAYGALPPPQLLQAALVAIVSAPLAELAESGVPNPIDSEAALPTALALCCHPGVVGGPVDPSRRSTVNAGMGGAGDEGAQAAPEAGKAGRASLALWRRVYTQLVLAAGFAPALTPAPLAGLPEDSESLSDGSGKRKLVSKTVSVAPAALDALLQRPDVTASLSALLGGRFGLWSPSHASRLTAARAVGLLMRGTAWMADRRTGVAAPALRKGWQKGTSPSATGASDALVAAAGARPFLLQAVLPLLLTSLATLTSDAATLTPEDISVWRTPEGTLAEVGAGEGEGMWHGDLGFSVSSQRAVRTSKKGSRMAEAEEDAWVAQLKEELAAKKAAEEAAKAKAAGAKAGAAKPGAPGAKPGPGGKPAPEDPNAVKLREQSSTRARVQSLYCSAVATLGALRALLEASPAAAQPLLPQVLPVLLPALASPLLAPHAGLAVRAALRSASCNTVVASPPAGLLADWERALSVVMQAQPASFRGAVAAFAGPDAAGTSPPPPFPSGGVVSSCLPVLRRLLGALCPACLPEGSFNKSLLQGDEADADAVARDEDDARIHGAVARVAPRPLPPSAFTALFPVLHAVLTASPPLPLLQPALSLVSAHAVLPTRVAARVDPVWATGGEATFEDGSSESTSGSPATPQQPPAVAGVVTLALAKAVAYPVPLGPSLADGSATVQVPCAGVRWAASAAGAMASCLADAPSGSVVSALLSSSTDLDVAAASATAGDAAGDDGASLLPCGCGTPDSDYFALRSLREPLAMALLHVLRVAPRTVPAPDEVLKRLVRGTDAAAAGAGHDSDDDSDSDSDSDSEEGEQQAAAAPEDGTQALLHAFTLAEAAPLASGAGLLSPFAHVRAGCLAGLDHVLSVHTGASGLVASKPEDVEWAAAVDAASAGESGAVGVSVDALKRATVAAAEAKGLLVTRLWVAVHDGDEDNAAHGELLWSRHGCKLGDGFTAALLPLLSHADEGVRGAAARAIAAGVASFSGSVDAAIKALTELFLKNAEAASVGASGPGGAGGFAAPPPKATAPGFFAGDSGFAAAAAAASIKTRVGVLATLGALADRKALPIHSLPIALPFVIQRGLADPVRAVVDAAVAAGRAIVDGYGESHVRLLLPVLEGFLEKGGASPLAAPSESGRDQQREGCVVLLGACAVYLPPGDPKVDSILRTLLDTLNTPSEPVQKAVAGRLPPLAKGLKDKGPEAAADVLSLLLGRLLESPSFAVRRGAAFGLAAVVKGLGLGALKQHNLLTVLEEAAGDKAEPARQGAMFAYETLCGSLGVLFEPYVTRVLPTLLKGASDTSEAVRDAAAYAGKAVMGLLTGHGVKLVLPSVLGGLSESAWRTKQASIHLLGSMAFLAPKQLGQALPSIVPRLCDAFEDPHPKIQAATKEALTVIGQVIRNPEVAVLVPVLLAALTDPADKTAPALGDLASTSFVHAIDPASLALIVPILRRGLADRSTSVKAQAAGIVGNMCALVGEPRDIVPYLPALLPVLRKGVCDPIPDTRSVASRALGSLMKGVGEDQMPDLLPWLVDTMRSESGSTVERSGAAQAIAEVLTSVGPERIGTFTLDLLPLAGAPKHAPREGILWLLTFLPASLGRAYTALLPRTFPVVLSRLADDSEVVRDVALRAGTVTVKNFARSDAKLLGPPLEGALFDRSWRVRQGGCTLVGQLINEITGKAGPHVVAGNTAGGALAPDRSLDDFVEDEYASDSDSDDRGNALDEDDDDGLLGGGAQSDSDSEEESSPAPGGDEVRSPSAKAGELPPSKGGKAGRGGDFYGKKVEKGPKEEHNKRKKLTVEEQEAKDKSNKRSDRISAAAAAVRGGGGGGGKAPAGKAQHPAALLSEKERLAAERRRAEALLLSSSLAAMDAAGKAVAIALGLEGRRSLLAALYATRCDVSAVVRQQGLKVWKDVVANTPKTLREILPAIMRLVISALATDNEERRVVAGRVLGDVVRKLGDRVLPEIVPILRAGLASPVPATRQGVCLGLAEVIEAATKQQIEAHVGMLVPAVRDALCDTDSGVRDAAARAFNTLTTALGQAAVEQTVPSLLAAMDTDDEEASSRARAGLQAVVALRGKEILPSLIPKLVAAPLSLFHARALAGVASVVSSMLHYHILTILPPMVAALAGEDPLAEPSLAGPQGSPEAVTDVLSSPLGEACAAVLCAVDDVGVAWTVAEVCKYLSDPRPARRRVGAWLLGRFIAGTSADISGQVPVLLKELIGCLSEPDEHALKVRTTRMRGGRLCGLTGTTCCRFCALPPTPIISTLLNQPPPRTCSRAPPLLPPAGRLGGSLRPLQRPHARPGGAGGPRRLHPLLPLLPGVGGALQEGCVPSPRAHPAARCNQSTRPFLSTAIAYRANPSHPPPPPPPPQAAWASTQSSTCPACPCPRAWTRCCPSTSAR